MALDGMLDYEWLKLELDTLWLWLQKQRIGVVYRIVKSVNLALSVLLLLRIIYSYVSYQIFKPK